VLVVNYEMADDSPVLAWQARVVRELARRADGVAVLTERLGAHAAPPGVRVEEIVRPAFPPVLARRAAALGQAVRLCRAERVQAVFVHMAHRQAYRLFPAFRALRLPVLLWYAHGAVTWHLRLAHLAADRVVSSTPEGFRLPSRKAHFIGQGVDTDLFALRRGPGERTALVAVGRVSRRKRLDVLLAAMEHLRDSGLRLRVVGGPLTPDDRAYEAELRGRAAARGLPVEFTGFIPLERLPAVYESAALQLHASATDSMDKAVLEALASGCPTLTSNPAFRDLLASAPALILRDDRPETIAARVRAVLADPAGLDPGRLRGLVVGRHDLGTYAGKILSHLEALVSR
jgi:glycosyltransferase involved in cell wall biosynthesis